MELDKFTEFLKQALDDEGIKKKLLEMKAPDDAGDRAARSEKQLAALEEKLKRLQEEFQQHTGDQEKDKERSAQLLGENEVLRTRNTELQKQLETVRAELKQETARLNGQLRDAEQKLSEQDAQIRNTRQQAESLSQENAGLKDKLGLLNNQLEKEKNDWRNQLHSAEREKENLEKKLQQSEEKRAPFLPLLGCYHSYRLLPEPLLRSLSPILPADDPIRFWVCGCQINSLFHLWDAVKLQLETIAPEQIAVLTEILAFFLNQYNSIWDTPVYELMSEETGKPFDQQRHIRGNTCSPYQGNIQKVLFTGIWNRNRRVVERKCVVQF